VTLGYEGGLSTGKADPGNWTGGAVGKGVLKGTKYGISAAAFPNLDIAALTIAEVTPIYKSKYWDMVRGDDLPPGLDLVTFDYGVNSGTRRAICDLQAVVGAAVDGAIGPLTLEKVAKADGKAAIQALCARRLGYLQHLKIWNAFKTGWSARVANVEARGVAMFLSAGGALSAEARQSLLGESEAAGKKATTNLQVAGTGASAGVFGAGAGDHSALMIGVAVGVVGVMVGVFLTLYHRNKARADAYAAAAGGDDGGLAATPAVDVPAPAADASQAGGAAGS
jgi:lysozyme family protein